MFKQNKWVRSQGGVEAGRCDGWGSGMQGGGAKPLRTEEYVRKFVSDVAV